VTDVKATQRASPNQQQRDRSLLAGDGEVDRTGRKDVTIGYTGFVPRSKNYYGQTYRKNITDALSEFSGKVPHDPTDLNRTRFTDAEGNPHSLIEQTPIPGFTGHIPGKRESLGEPYGRSVVSALDQFSTIHTEAQQLAETQRSPKTELSKTSEEIRGRLADKEWKDTYMRKTDGQWKSDRPLPGYTGHIPGMQFEAEKSYSQSVQSCAERH